MSWSILRPLDVTIFLGRDVNWRSYDLIERRTFRKHDFFFKNIVNIPPTIEMLNCDWYDFKLECNSSDECIIYSLEICIYMLFMYKTILILKKKWASNKGYIR